MSFLNFIFDKLPIYYKINDSYKDINGEGLLERYLRIFGLELDNNIKPLVDNYLNNIDPFTVDPKYLMTLGYTLGSPPDLTGNNSTYAKLLAYIISVYKIKGTIKAYQLLFALLGYNVTIIEYAPSEEVYFDNAELLDETDGDVFDEGCPCCSDYSVVVNTILNIGGTCTSPNNISITPQILPYFNQVIAFNEPINAHLRSIIQGGLVCEQVQYCYEEDISLTVLQYSNFDDALLFDNSLDMDDITIVSSQTTHIDCSHQTGGIGSMEIANTFIVS